MSSPKKSSNWDTLLGQLNYYSRLEQLRPFLKHHGLFSRRQNPTTTPIELEMLNKLARVWKLHLARNFWRDNATMEAIVATLHTHLTEHQAELEAVLPSSPNPKSAPAVVAAAAPPPPAPDATGPVVVRQLKFGGSDLFGLHSSYLDANIYLSHMLPLGSVGGKTSLDRRSFPPPARSDSMSDDAGADPAGQEEEEEGGDERDVAVGQDEEAEHLVQALVNLANAPACREKAIAMGAVPRLVAAWASTEAWKNENVRDQVACALCRLCSEGTRAHLIDSGALPAIASLVGVRDPATQQLCADTLCQLASLENNVPPMLFGGAVTTLASLYRVQPATATAISACLRNMVSPKTHRGLFAKGEAVALLLTLAQDPGQEPRRNAAIALRCLCRHKRSQQKLMQDGVATRLLALLREHDDVTKVQAADALCALCNNKHTRARLVKEGVIPAILLLANSGAWGAFLCLSCVCPRFAWLVLCVCARLCVRICVSEGVCLCFGYFCADSVSAHSSAAKALLMLSQEEGPGDVKGAIIAGGCVQQLLKLWAHSGDKLRGSACLPPSLHTTVWPAPCFAASRASCASFVTPCWFICACVCASLCAFVVCVCVCVRVC